MVHSAYIGEKKKEHRNWYMPKPYLKRPKRMLHLLFLLIIYHRKRVATRVQMMALYMRARASIESENRVEGKNTASSSMTGNLTETSGNSNVRLQQALSSITKSEREKAKDLGSIIKEISKPKEQMASY